jgi:hypothetical protein
MKKTASAILRFLVSSRDHIKQISAFLNRLIPVLTLITGAILFIKFKDTQAFFLPVQRLLALIASLAISVGMEIALLAALLDPRLEVKWGSSKNFAYSNLLKQFGTSLAQYGFLYGNSTVGKVKFRTFLGRVYVTYTTALLLILIPFFYKLSLYLSFTYFFSLFTLALLIFFTSGVNRRIVKFKFLSLVLGIFASTLITSYGIVYFLGNSTVHTFLAVALVLLLGTLLPIPSSFGLREWMFILILGSNYDSLKVVSASILTRLIIYALEIVAVALFWFIDHVLQVGGKRVK